MQSVCNAHPVAGVERPQRILYGADPATGLLCFVEESYGRALAEEVAAVKACTTVGEAMELDQRLQLTTAPGAPVDEDEMVELELAPDSPYDWSESGPAADGDWPPMPSALAFKTFRCEDREAWDLLSGEVQARVESTVLNGEILEIVPEREKDLLAVLSRLGVQAMRDDAIIASIGTA